jgi:hypothetical protein
MSTYNPKELSEPDFERSLLDSARVDPLPQNVQIAWANFAGAMRLAASHVEPGSGLHTIKHPDQTVSRSVEIRGGLGKAATWLIVGAMGGSALTAALLIGRTRVTPSDPGRAAARLALAVSAPSKGNSALQFTAMSPTASAVASDAETATSLQQWASHTKTPTPSTGLVEQGVADGQAGSTHPSIEATLSLTNAPKPTLADQVRRLDAARTACRVGAYNEVIRLVENYHREFPSGVLAPDADVVEIEALVGKQDRAAAARHARAFLAKYPNDPHATMVQHWSEP